MIKIVSASSTVILIFGWIGIAWYFSDQIIKPAHGPATFPETAERVTTSANDVHIVSLMRSSATSKEGRYGLVWSGGSAMLGKIVLKSPNRIDRIVLSGVLPPEGAKANMSGTYGTDPKAALGLDFQEVTVPTELGAAPAWYIPADTKGQVASAADGWAITVHGSSADRKQSLKFVPVLHRAGLLVLDITHRNDIGTALKLTNWRLGFDVHRVDALRFPLKVHAPILLLQDMADQVMPLSAARDFVSSSTQSGWPIQYAEFADAGHRETWKSDPERCEAPISGFLRANASSEQMKSPEQ